MKTDSAYNALI